MVRRPQPGQQATQRAIHLRKHAGQVASAGPCGQYRCFAECRRRFAKRSGEVAIPPRRGSDWRFTAGRQRDRGFRGHPGGRHYSAKSPRRASEDEVLRCLPLASVATADIIRFDVYRRGNSHRVWLSRYEYYFAPGHDRKHFRELALQMA